MTATEIIGRLNQAWERETEDQREALQLLKEEAKRERKELESYIVKAR